MTDEQIRHVAASYYADGTYEEDLIGFARALLAASTASDKQEAVADEHQAFEAWYSKQGFGERDAFRAWMARAAIANTGDKGEDRYEALEREHMGDPEKQTGIYAPRHPAQPAESGREPK